MEEKCEAAERVLLYAMETERLIWELDKRFERVAFSCGPSGYVGCSQECRGAGERRRTGFTEDIVEYLLKIGIKKDKLIISLRPLVEAFERMRKTRSGHVIYWCVGRGMSSQQYADKYKYSRRHARRLYIKAMSEFYDLLVDSGGKELIEKLKP